MKFASTVLGVVVVSAGAVDAWSFSGVWDSFQHWMFGDTPVHHRQIHHHQSESGKATGSLDFTGTNWAVIVAGSDGYFNYRHQADACHAYQILRANGYPEDHIILMMKDDVANNIRNPFPGNLINQPGGENVYEGCKVDYRGSDVTPENFEKVLTGQKMHVGNGKTLKSGPDDHVFVNFIDHGGVGLIAFPEGKIVTSRQLHSTLEKMKDNDMYGKLVFYMEACESGSMFDNLLPNDWNIFATTASTGNQSSYATYWDMSRRTFLGDLYSVSWMEDSDKHFFIDHAKDIETLEKQYTQVYARTSKSSQPQQYGDIPYANKATIEEFQQYQDNNLNKPNFGRKRRADQLKSGMNGKTYAENRVQAELDAVSSRDVTAQTLQRLMGANDVDDEHQAAFGDIEAELQKEYRNIQRAEDRFMSVAWNVAGSKSNGLHEKYVSSIKDHDCLSDSIVAFHEECHPIDEYHIRFTRVLAHLCDSGHTATEVKSAIVNTPSCQW
ncbi:hypothetical protein SARC_04929 [Sphaeroforma arctica JP610]|uniref:legumain n=1 Tax=Sphaeroforma arctica JP610 TaxID=667725 RepID=A0A0L0G1U0_9EUKA|nr:hypothetical protein SARC_04929 [Sphaeroforma arctica JP610]KNC82796.1 hypothetical protein SARC_04929 [Sphaeroforma arctica JP610]|eukprot:XP_014156698.1 hypothetical protein SARC_04929 [Sphaeroforma arctica JP610]